MKDFYEIKDRWVYDVEFEGDSVQKVLVLHHTATTANVITDRGAFVQIDAENVHSIQLATLGSAEKRLCAALVQLSQDYDESVRRMEEEQRFQARLQNAIRVLSGSFT